MKTSTCTRCGALKADHIDYGRGTLQCPTTTPGTFTTTRTPMKKTTTKKRTPRPTRAYTRGFTPSDGIGTEIRLTQVPVSFKRGVMAKAKREGVSVRGMLLTHLQEWMEAK